MRCLRGHQRHGAFSCRWLRAAGLFCKSLGVTVSSTEPTQKKRNNAASARLLAAKRLRAAVVACGAVGAGAARGAATNAVKSAPGTIYRRGSCHPEADQHEVTSSLHVGSGLHRGPSRCKGAQHRSRRASGPSSVRFGCLGGVTDTEPLKPSTRPAHLQPRLLRSFGQRSGARRREKR